MKYFDNGENLTIETPREILQYGLGGFMYIPATHPKLEEKIHTEKVICCCLEDSIGDTMVEVAEKTILQILKKEDITTENLKFLRVRDGKHLQRLVKEWGSLLSQFVGIVCPKWDTLSAPDYFEGLAQLELVAPNVYILPVLETWRILDIKTRQRELVKIREKLKEKAYSKVLNIRVGATDMCNYYGVRRGKHDTIYDMSHIGGCLSDILLVFGREYVVSGPVYEYYGQEGQIGLKKELAQDILQGFIGKTCIHPTQLDTVNVAYKVKESDYQDSLKLLGFDDKDGVSSGCNGDRMLEKKTHINWAKKVQMMARIYGIEG